MRDLKLIYVLIRYSKQRGYVSSSHVAVKFLPISLAILVVNVILRVKPVEEEFLRLDSITLNESSNYLCTIKGIPVDPTKMSKILANTLEEHGLGINLHDLRHALEAFSHKFSQSNGTNWNPVYALMANHSPGTSSGYGRDGNSFFGIPANISEANSNACNAWNLKILDSPSSETIETRTQLMNQLQLLDLLDAECIEEEFDQPLPMTIASDMSQNTSSDLHDINGMLERNVDTTQQYLTSVITMMVEICSKLKNMFIYYRSLQFDEV